MQNSLWQYIILTQLAHGLPRNIFKSIHMNSQLSTVRSLNMSTILRKLLRQTTGQTTSVLKYSTLLFFTESLFLLYHTKWRKASSFIFWICFVLIHSDFNMLLHMAFSSPIIIHTSCKSEMRDDMERILNMHISNSFLLNGDSRK